MAKKTNGELKIEKGVPIPVHGNTSGLSALFKQMDVGDSLFLNGERTSASARASYIFGKGKYMTRKEGDGYRIWRTA